MGTSTYSGTAESGQQVVAPWVELIEGDCRDVLREIEADSVDLTVTSPPYDNLRSYGGAADEWGPAAWEDTLAQLYRVTKPGGVVVWVVGDATVEGSETGTSFKQALYAAACGFNLHDTMIYEKAQAVFGSTKAYLQCFEYMFVFSKGAPKTLNFLRDRKNVRGGKTESVVSSGKDADGVSGERVYKTAAEFGKRKNIWTYGTGGGKTGHPAPFPQALAEDHIKTWSEPGDTVLDPFFGSGTTGLAARALGRNAIGIELNPEYFDIASERLWPAAKEAAE